MDEEKQRAAGHLVIVRAARGWFVGEEFADDQRLRSSVVALQTFSPIQFFF